MSKALSMKKYILNNKYNVCKYQLNSIAINPTITTAV